jgi:hypothetical protein
VEEVRNDVIQRITQRMAQTRPAAAGREAAAQ